MSGEAKAAKAKPKIYPLGSEEAERALKEGGPKVKVVHFMRHGQGYHNVRNKIVGKIAACTDSALFDAQLTEQGKAEAALVQAKVPELRPEVVLVSPLRRTLQTATIAFHDAKAPFVAYEDLREVYGCTAEQRRPVSVAKMDFPVVDFSRVQGDEDPEPSALLENPLHLVERQKHFLEILEQREESNVAVVTHSLWLLSFFRDSVSCDDERIKEFFRTGEVKSAVIKFA